MYFIEKLSSVYLGLSDLRKRCSVFLYHSRLYNREFGNTSRDVLVLGSVFLAHNVDMNVPVSLNALQSLP